jgi:hypothetical protein
MAGTVSKRVALPQGVCKEEKMACGRVVNTVRNNSGVLLLHVLAALATFIIPKGVLKPDGNPGHSQILDFNTLRCQGPGCPEPMCPPPQIK